jgi:hypothetical protein
MQICILNEIAAARSWGSSNVKAHRAQNENRKADQQQQKADQQPQDRLGLHRRRYRSIRSSERMPAHRQRVYLLRNSTMASRSNSCFCTSSSSS